MYTLITGTTSGIGKEFAELFAEKGYNLITVAMNEEKLKEQKQTLESKYNISVKYIVKDLSIEESYSEIYNEVIERYGWYEINVLDKSKIKPLLVSKLMAIIIANMVGNKLIQLFKPSFTPKRKLLNISTFLYTA